MATAVEIPAEKARRAVRSWGRSGFLHCAAHGETVSSFGRNDGSLVSGSTVLWSREVRFFVLWKYGSLSSGREREAKEEPREPWLLTAGACGGWVQLLRGEHAGGALGVLVLELGVDFFGQ